MREARAWAGGCAGFAVVAVALSILLAAGQAVSQAPGSAREASLQAWERFGPVLQHPRCLNCHQPSVPLQGEAGRRHSPGVARGTDNRGVPGLRCGACHGANANNEASQVPGAAHWKMAPRSMSWAGLSLGEICRAIRNPAKNGGRSPSGLVKHFQEDSLVHWAWDPGGKRESVSMPYSVFIEFVEEWVRTGAHCPD
jgi:hypothetical protein